MKYSLSFIATTSFALNAFLRTHLLALAEAHAVTIFVNTSGLPAGRRCGTCCAAPSYRHLPQDYTFARFTSAVQVAALRPGNPAGNAALPDAQGRLAVLTSLSAGVPRRFHTLTGQVWTNETGIDRRGQPSKSRLCPDDALRDTLWP